MGIEMTRTVISIPGAFFSDRINGVLTKSGNFRTVVPDQDSDVFSVCRETGAEILLMGVSYLTGFRLDDRKQLVKHMREGMPECKLIIIIDNAMMKDETYETVQMKKTGIIDQFIFYSNDLDYLTAAMESL